MKNSMYQQFAQLYDQIFDFNPKIFEGLFDKPYLHALDIGCGTGRLTKLIYDHQIKSLGIDLDEAMIKVAKTNYPEIDFKVMNMLNLDQLGSFDLITCFGNTLPHINPIEFNRFFKLIEDKLTNEGVLWIQLLNYDYILKHQITSLKPIIKHNFKFYRDYEIHKDRISFHTRLETLDHVIEGTTTLYPYQLIDFLNIEKTHQLHVSCYGSLTLKPYDVDEDYYVYVKVQKRL